MRNSHPSSKRKRVSVIVLTCGLFKGICFPHHPENWRLFIDSSNRSLKAVLLHNGNKQPSISIAYSFHLKEGYRNIRLLLEKINYGSYKWDICGYFKMLGFLLGLHGGYTKYYCCHCLWDSRATDQHYIQRVWPEKEQLVPSMHSVIQEALVPRQKILLPPLHIKLGLLKQFIKALDPNSATLHYIRKMFSHLPDTKVKGVMFTGPQIRVMLASADLEQTMSVVERNAWEAFRMVATYFLGNNKCEDYEVIMESLIQHYKLVGCRVSVKLHYLHLHLE